MARVALLLALLALPAAASAAAACASAPDALGECAAAAAADAPASSAQALAADAFGVPPVDVDGSAVGVRCAAGCGVVTRLHRSLHGCVVLLSRFRR
jgi:streptogramin lyase